MSRVYISGPVTGIDNYKENFEEAVKILSAGGFKEIINPMAFDGMLPDTLSYEDCLAFDITLLSFCDTIYMLRGWEHSKGANREYGYALAMKMNIIFQDE